MEELLGQEASSNTEEVHASIRGVEQHFELELTRARAQSDYDFSRCMKSLQSLESTVQQSLKEPAAVGSNVVGAREPEIDTTNDIDLKKDLDDLSPMQRGLYKQIGGALNALVSEKRRKHLRELQQNLSAQPAGPMKEQQDRVLQMLQQQLDR